jgi:hypothetical protein
MGATGATGASAPAGSTGVTSTAQPPIGATGTSGEIGATSPPQTAVPPVATAPGAPTTQQHPHTHTGPGTNAHHHHKVSPNATRPRRHAPPPTPPTIIKLSTQPQSGSGSGASGPAGRNGGGGSGGALAPPPGLFAGSNPLAGVLPGAWNDPFIVPGGTSVPQFFVETFRIPPFLLSIYQSAGTAYDVPWQVLAAINEVETDYGTNLDTSSAGAIGWMQFLPSTWRLYGVDASATGAKDPYNAADAIFGAARYLNAAGAARDLPGAIFAYNHSWNYVKSVLLRAEEFSGEPTALIQSLTELAEGDFPVQLSYHASYAPASASAGAGEATGAVAGGTGGATGATGPAPAPGAVGAAATPPAQAAKAAAIYAGSHAAVVAVQDGTIVAIGHNRRLGRYLRLRDGFGDTFTYGHLASLAGWYPTLKGSVTAVSLSTAAPAGLAPGPRPNGRPATAGSQYHGRRVTRKLFASPRSHVPPRAAAQARKPTRKAARVRAATSTLPLLTTLNLASSFSRKPVFTPIAVLEHATNERQSAKPRLDVVRVARHHVHAGARVNAAHANLAHANAARATRARPSLLGYFTGAFGVSPKHLELVPLRVGSRVLAGTILGRLPRTKRPHLLFELRPASEQTPIDPRPLLDAWSQLATLELHRQGLAQPFYGPNLHATNAGVVKVTSPVDLAREVLTNARVALPACERAAIASGSVSPTVLASVELLSLRRVPVSVSGAWCDSAHAAGATPGLLRTGNAIALTPTATIRTSTALAAAAARALAKLPAAARPAISTSTVHNTVVISFAPTQEPTALAASAAFTGGFALSSARWSALDAHLRQIQEPRMPTAVSAAALPDPKNSPARNARTR